MALITSYYEYRCSYGELLFTRYDINKSSMLFGINYLFVARNIVNARGLRIRLTGNAIASCNVCLRNLGGFVFNEMGDDIRFARHRLLRQKRSIYLCNATDENGRIIHYKHTFEETNSQPANIPAGTLDRESDSDLQSSPH